MAKRIAVVEDDPSIREDMTELLESEGYRVVTYANGRLALDGLAADPADLILLDLMMPVMNGYEFLEARAQHPVLSGRPVIVQSADTRAEAKLQGADIVTLLRKPLELDAFLSLVAQHA